MFWINSFAVSTGEVESKALWETDDEVHRNDLPRVLGNRRGQGSKRKLRCLISSWGSTGSASPVGAHATHGCVTQAWSRGRAIVRS
jgi:hypothetical protein